MSAKALFKEIKEHREKVNGPHFLMSAENPGFPEKNELGMDHATVLTHLQKAGYDAHEVVANGGTDKSIIVYGIGPEHVEKLHALASRLGQDSSIHSDGKNHEMRFHHGERRGKKATGSSTNHFNSRPANFYTTLPGGAHHFSHNFDKVE